MSWNLLPALQSLFVRWASVRLRRASGEPAGAGPAPLPDPSFRRMMVYVFVGSRGGQNRVKIVEMLKGEPANPNKISEKLGLDYKTVQHHIKLLEQNQVIVASSKGTYGAVYFLTPYFEKYFESIRSMWARFGQS
ncbi:MAG: winged helix-turn-helix domain-containing protein [Thaumarchaeota archaeon]|nr:winged helix-turn-helix domain-containing protein [Nitrososphaerota archaeon]